MVKLHVLSRLYLSLLELSLPHLNPSGIALRKPPCVRTQHQIQIPDTQILVLDDQFTQHGVGMVRSYSASTLKTSGMPCQGKHLNRRTLF